MPVLAAQTTAEAAALLRGAPSPVVVIPVYDAYDDVVCCLEAVAQHTPESIAILVVDDAGADRRVRRLLGPDARIVHRVVVLEHLENRGYVQSCNDAFAATPGLDVVLLNSDVVVGAEWLERLKGAAYSADVVATATTLTNHGTIVSVPWRNTPVPTLPAEMTPADAARRVAAGSRRLRPSIPTAIGHCCYVRRNALDLVGPFDDTFDPGYAEEIDFSQRAVAHGFRHVVADDVFTYHHGSRSFGDGPMVVERRRRHDAIVRQRYPAFDPWAKSAATDPASALADALASARRALQGLTVGVDALCLGPLRMGTQYNVMETIRALACRPEIKRLIAFVPSQVGPDVQKMREELPEVEFRSVDLPNGMPRNVVDVIYRPYQLTTSLELEFLQCAADRFVVNQLDTIAFENPTYFGSHADWLAYRDLTRLTFALAHGVAFTSGSSHRAAQSEGLLDARTPWAIVSCGVGDRCVNQPGERPSPCSPAESGFLFCLGASYLHKNRRFALGVWTELRRRGWRGRIVLAGPTPPYGHSRAAAAEFLFRNPDFRHDVVTLGAISEAEKRWLYGRAALVLYPSTIEGFGLVPFEAAQHGVPTLATRMGSLDEVLPDDIPVIDAFDISAAASRAWALLHDPSLAGALVRRLEERSRSFTWSATAEKLIGLFDAALGQPRGRVRAIEGEGGALVGVSPDSGAFVSAARHQMELRALQQEIELLRARETAARTENHEERERLATDVYRLRTELAAIGDTRTWRFRAVLLRSRVLRWLLARRVQR